MFFPSLCMTPFLTSSSYFHLGLPHGFSPFTFMLWNLKFSRQRVWCSELSSGIYCRLKLLSTDVSEVRTASIIRDPRRQLWTPYFHVQNLPWDSPIIHIKNVFISSYFVFVHFPSNVRFQILMAASMKFGVFWDVPPCSHVEVGSRFRRMYCLHHQGDYGGSMHL
jgi:hypothetical protein